MQNYLIIGIGGFLGAVARYAIGLWITEKWGRSFPLGTFFVNTSGCFLMGFLIVLFSKQFDLAGHWRAFLIIGFLGAYTTFSTFEYETGALVRNSELLVASLNVILSVFMGFAALKLGEVTARIL